MRYFFLDRITHVEVGRLARGVKAVSFTDDVLHDHFPDLPILPGALQVEAAAQLGGYLLEASVMQPGGPVRRAVLGQIDRARFSRPAEPGDLLELETTLTHMMETAGRVDFTGTVRGETAVAGTLTFVLRVVDSQRVHEQRRALYRMWTKGLGPQAPIP